MIQDEDCIGRRRVIDHDLEYNISQVEKFLGQARESGADLLCFGETFLQGFDSLHWNFAEDRETALRLDGPVMEALCRKTAETGVDLLLGFVEREGERLYSSCALLSQGKPLHCYRRISKGWKEYQRTDSHYCEGTEITPFSYRGVRCLIALCGDPVGYAGALLPGRGAALLAGLYQLFPGGMGNRHPGGIRPGRPRGPAATRC